MWKPTDIDADVMRWLIRRKIHVRPLVSVEEAVQAAHGASDAMLNVLAERLRLSGNHDSIRSQLLERLGVKTVTESEDGQNAPNLDARRSLVYEMRESGETWENVAEAMEISVTTARKDHSIWKDGVSQ